MHAVITWSGFLGAWLLVAGPLFQAAVELDQEEFHRPGVPRAARQVGTRPRLSPWWWLLPPVAYVLQRRRQRDHRRKVFDALTREEVESFVDLANVSTGWAMVAAGAFFIAVKETYEVAELYGWPGWWFALLLVVMLAASAANTVVRTRRAHRMLDAAGTATRATSPTTGPAPGA